MGGLITRIRVRLWQGLQALFATIEPEPNLFLAFRVGQPGTGDACLATEIEHAQNILIERDPVMGQYIVPVSKLHMTMDVFHMDEDFTLRMRARLQDYILTHPDPYVYSLTPRKINIWGNSVVCLEFERDAPYDKFRAALGHIVRDFPFTTNFKRCRTPHISLFNSRKLHSFESAFSGEHATPLPNIEQEFVLKSLELCVIGSQNEHTNFYRSLFSIPLHRPKP